MYKKKPKDVSLKKHKQRRGRKIYKRSTKTKQKLKQYGGNGASYILAPIFKTK